MTNQPMSPPSTPIVYPALSSPIAAIDPDGAGKNPATGIVNLSERRGEMDARGRV